MADAKRRSQPKRSPAVTGQRELSPVQQLICDEIADMLIHGGHSDDTENMILAALGNNGNRRKAHLVEDPEKRAREVDELMKRDAPEWTAELTMEWKRNKRSKPEERPTPQDASARIRELIIEDLRDRFESFLGDGTPEEHRLMRDILMDHESVNRGRHADAAGVPLAEAFNYEVENRKRGYVKVPGRLVEQVEKYAQCLMAADRQSTPAA